MIEVYLIRHAESTRNLTPHLIGGRSNAYPLSKRGEVQAELLRYRFAAEEILFDEVYSSTAIRAKQTALIACKDMGFSLDTIIFSDDLLELNQGEWEGKERKDVHTPRQLAIMNADYLNFQPPDGESQRDVEERMFKFLERYIIPCGLKQEKRFGVFSHGMAIRCLLRRIMGFSPSLTYRMMTENTSITQLRYDERGWTPIRINDAAHLLVIDPSFSREPW